MIFTLSCTGNTRWAADLLAQMTNDKVVSIFDAINGDCSYRLRAGERVGFCLPVHGWRLQPLVRDFIAKLNLVVPVALMRGGHTMERFHIIAISLSPAATAAVSMGSSWRRLLLPKVCRCVPLVLSSCRNLMSVCRLWMSTRTCVRQRRR